MPACNAGWLSDYPYLSDPPNEELRNFARDAIFEMLKQRKERVSGLRIMKTRKSGEFGITLALGNGRAAVPITVSFK